MLYPNPLMGPMRGEINIAPITTAVEFMLSPMDATTMAKARIQRLVPLKTIPFSISSWMVS